MTLAGAAGVDPGVRPASCVVRPSNIAVCGRPSSGRTVPAGACDSGGDCAGWAGATAAGVSSRSFAEHPVASTGKTPGQWLLVGTRTDRVCDVLAQGNSQVLRGLTGI